MLVGAGHAHVEVLRAFGMRPLPGVRLTLVAREVETPYSGMLPGLVAGHYAFDETHIDTGPLARFANARLYNDAAVGLDLAGQKVLCRRRPPVPYDILSLDIGSTPNTGSVIGAEEHAIPVKPIDGFLGRFDALAARVLKRRGKARVALVGAGAGGVELLLAVERRLRRDVGAAGLEPGSLSFVLVSGSADILPSFPKAVGRRFARILRERGIAVVTGARVVRVEAGRLHRSEGEPVLADEILWTTEAAPPPWLRGTGLALDEGGFVAVDANLRAVGREEVFAAGDVAAFGPHALPKSGVYAVRAGPVLAHNIRSALSGRRLRPYRPQRDALSLVSTGERHAIGTRNGLTVEGDWVWRWKDWLDRRFMERFNHLPLMEAPEADPALFQADTSGEPPVMRCGGCGAKVGAAVLSRALAGIRPAWREDVIVGLGSPDDAAVLDMGGPDLAVHTVDYFRAPLDDPYVFGKIAANHALGDIFAMGAQPRTALAIATLPYGREPKVEADLTAMMIGASEILSEADCAIVGGHTSEGAELALGFAVVGVAGRRACLRKGGIRPGDALVLTKPIGTGLLLAAHMRGVARARWIMVAIEQMTRSNRDAAAILRARGTRAATDVTGFGLIGHLLEMVRASGVQATLWLDAIPLLPGAREMVAQGVLSSLQPQNLRAGEAVRGLDQARRSARDAEIVALVFDPQTAGGLIGAVPAEAARSCVAELKAAGYPEAAVIGVAGVQDDPGRPIVLRPQAAAATGGAGSDERRHGPTQAEVSP